MSTEIFRASAQYDDMRGSVAADRHDDYNLTHYMEERSLISNGEVVLGAEVFHSIVHEENAEGVVDVSVILSSGDGFDNIRQAVDSGQPLRVRKIKFELPIADFLKLFKRFSLTMSSHSLIEGKEIIYEEQD